LCCPGFEAQEIDHGFGLSPADIDAGNQAGGVVFDGVF
jgi:hypothetical protein